MNKHISLSEQLANDLREKAKVMDRGARFPSEMSLCRRYQVSRMTVSNALQRLVREGMLERRQGSGTYVTQSPLQAIHFVLSGPENSSFALLQSMLTVYEAVHNCAVNARCRFVTLSASATNSMMDTNVQSFKQLPKRSKIILFGYWFRHLFDIMLER
jgi:DNA-binding FadR family transcriptional regulator